MRGLLSMVALVLVVAALANCAGVSPPDTPSAPKTTGAAPTTKVEAPAWKVQWDQKVAAAKKEGEVTFYSTSGAGVRNEVSQAFIAAYGVNLNFVPAPPGELVQKMVKERSAGLNLTDAINAGGGTSLTGLKPNGLIKPIEPELILPEVKDPKAWVIGRLPLVDKDGLVFGMLASYERNVLINTDLVKSGEITSLKDLQNPKWKGKMIMQDPVSGAGLGLVSFMGGLWGTDEALEFMRGLVRQDTVFTRDWRMQVESVARGKYAIAIAPHPEAVAEFKALGSPIVSVKVAEGATLQTVGGALAIAAQPAHPNASVVFLNWLLSKEGHAAYVKGVRLPGARVDAPREGIDESYFPAPDEKIVYGDEAFFLRQGEMRPMVEKIIAAQGTK